MNILKPLTFIALSAALSSCGPKQAAAPGEAASALISRLGEAVAQGTFYYAHQDDLVYGHDWRVEDISGDPLGRSDVEAVCGSFPGIVGFDLGGIELGDEANLDGVSFDLMRRSAVEHVSRGGMVTFSWHPRNPLTGGDAWDVSSDKVVSSVLEGGQKAELFMTWLSRAADFLSSLKDASGAPVAVIFRPWHENVGSWFWWGGKLCSPSEYVALYQLTHDYMVSRGLTNIVWAYSPDSDASEEEFLERYPGDGFVDILGVDCYEYVGAAGIEEANAAFQAKLRHTLGYISSLASARGKLLALSETGFESLPYAQWWTGVLLPVLKEFPISYVLTWRNAWDRPTHYFGPFPGSDDAEDFRAFAAAPETLFL